MTEVDYCDQTPINVEFSFEEHQIMNNLIIHALDTYDFVIYEDLYDLPKESPIRKKRETLEIIKDKFLKLWSNRFN